MYRLLNVSKTFKDKENIVNAVNNVSLTIEKGSIHGIIGFSGAGKSTLVRCLNLLEVPDSGKVIFNGKDLMTLKGKELRKSRQKIGMIFQSFNLLAQRTVLGNICYPLEIAGVSKKEAVVKAKKLLEMVGIADKAKVIRQSFQADKNKGLQLREHLPQIRMCFYVMRQQVHLILSQQLQYWNY